MGSFETKKMIKINVFAIMLGHPAFSGLITQIFTQVLLLTPVEVQ